MTRNLTHLERLEAESIHIMREVVAEAEKPVMLYSVGKDSAVMLHLAMKAFYPAKPPFPFLHVDTTWKFREMIAFRDEMARKLGFDWSGSELQHVGRGVNGDVLGKPVQLDSVTIGDLQADNIEAVIIPEGLDVSLLGQSFLSRVDNVQIEGDRMTLN